MYGTKTPNPPTTMGDIMEEFFGESGFRHDPTLEEVQLSTVRESLAQSERDLRQHKSTFGVAIRKLLRKNRELKEELARKSFEVEHFRGIAAGYQQLYHQTTVDSAVKVTPYADLPIEECSFTSTAPALIRVFRWPWERKPCRR